MVRFFLVILLSILVAGLAIITQDKILPEMTEELAQDAWETVTQNAASLHPLSITAQREKTYPGSPITSREKLSDQASFTQEVVSYESDGLTIYALLTVPKGVMPAGGWPAIVFLHGYIPPEQYRTTERYEAYVAGFAREGFVVIKPDLRGHGDSEGQPEGAYFSPGYTTDALNAFASLAQTDFVNPNLIGVWGHSMGGHLALRSLVIEPRIRAAVIWAGVVGDYQDMYEWWSSRRSPWQPSPREQQARSTRSAQFIAQHSTPNREDPFWRSLSPVSSLSDLSAPLQLHHGTADSVVPVSFSEVLSQRLTELNKPHELFTYPGADHNLSGAAFQPALRRSIEFFQKNLAE